MYGFGPVGNSLNFTRYSFSKKPMRTILSLLLVIFLSSTQSLFSQTSPFEQEVQSLVEKYQNTSWEKGAAVFTGSSSIRMWKTLEKDFRKNAIINTGFGGSQTHDLLEHVDKLIIAFAPSKIFIYEGDNDVNAGKSTRQIIEEHFEIIEKVKEKLPEAEFYLISAKPSPSRWALKGEYQHLNDEMEKFCLNQSGVTYIDVWTPMLDKDGKPKEKLFIEDRLHMNKKGYKIWKKAVKPHMK